MDFLGRLGREMCTELVRIDTSVPVDAQPLNPETEALLELAGRTQDGRVLHRTE